MFTATWPSLKSSPMMQEIRIALKKKAEPGQATLSRKEANKTWREEILGILSEDQKKVRKSQRQENSKRKTHRPTQDSE